MNNNSVKTLILISTLACSALSYAASSHIAATADRCKNDLMFNEKVSSSFCLEDADQGWHTNTITYTCTKEDPNVKVPKGFVCNGQPVTHSGPKTPDEIFNKDGGAPLFSPNLKFTNIQFTLGNCTISFATPDDFKYGVIYQCRNGAFTPISLMAPLN